MEQFITEHGEMIVGGLIGILSLGLILGVIAFVANINVWSLNALIGG